MTTRTALILVLSLTSIATPVAAQTGDASPPDGSADGGEAGILGAPEIRGAGELDAPLAQDAAQSPEAQPKQQQQAVPEPPSDTTWTPAPLAPTPIAPTPPPPPYSPADAEPETETGVRVLAELGVTVLSVGAGLGIGAGIGYAIGSDSCSGWFCVSREGSAAIFGAVGSVVGVALSPLLVSAVGGRLDGRANAGAAYLGLAAGGLVGLGLGGLGDLINKELPNDAGAALFVTLIALGGACVLSGPTLFYELFDSLARGREVMPEVQVSAEGATVGFRMAI